CGCATGGTCSCVRWASATEAPAPATHRAVPPGAVTHTGERSHTPLNGATHRGPTLHMSDAFTASVRHLACRPPIRNGHSRLRNGHARHRPGHARHRPGHASPPGPAATRAGQNVIGRFPARDAYAASTTAT